MSIKLPKVNTQRSFSNKSVIYAISSLLFLLMFFLVLNTGYKNHLIAQQEIIIKATLSFKSAALSEAINSRILLLHGIKSFVLSNTEKEFQRNFDNYSKNLFSISNGIHSIIISLDGNKKYIYPSISKENILLISSIDSLSTKIKSTLKVSNKISISDPYKTNENNLFINIQKAFYKNEKFNGIITIVLDINSIFQQSHLFENTAKLNLYISDTRNNTLAGIKPDSIKTIEAPLLLADTQWNIAAYPKEGWALMVREPILIFQFTGILIIVLIAVLVFLFTNQQEKLKVKVRRWSKEYLNEYERRSRLESVLTRIAENAQDIIYRFTFLPEKHFEYISPAVEKITGYTAEEFYNDPDLPHKILHPDDLPIFNDIKFLKSDKPIILRFIRRDGKLIWIEQKNFNIYDNSGKLITVEGISRDITDQENIKKELFRLSNELKIILDSVPATIWYKDTENNFIWVNKAVTEFSGLTPEQINGKSAWEIFPEEAKKYYEDDLEVINSGKPKMGILEYATVSSGEKKWIYTDKIPVKDDNGKIIGLLAFAVDITEKKETEIKLLQLFKAVEQSPVSVIITDLNGQIEYVNPKFTRITGYEFEEVKGKNPRFLKSGEKNKEEYDNLWKTIAAGGEWTGEFHNKKKNGDLYWEFGSISAIKDKDGVVTHYMAIKEDITELKWAEELLRQSEEQYRKIFEEDLAGNFISSTDGQILTCNPAYIRLFGYDSFDEIKDIDIHHLYANAEERELMLKLLREKKKLENYELEMQRKDGSRIHVLENIIGQFDENDELIRIQGYIFDITERKKAEEEIRKAKELAEMSDKIKSEFLAQMSHEIRTPLNVILSYISLVKEELLNAKPDMSDKSELDKSKLSDKSEILDISFSAIDSGARRLIRTIDLILNMSQVQTGNLELFPQKTDLALDILIPIVHQLMPTAKVKGLELIFENLNGKSDLALDSYTVSQIFINLIDNAIKYTHQGCVKIKLRLDERKNYSVTVEDSGIGISEEFLNTIFSPFSQEETGYTRSYEGTGLGLALVKKYCELNNANVFVESTKGKGSKFTVVFNTY